MIVRVDTTDPHARAGCALALEGVQWLRLGTGDDGQYFAVVSAPSGQDFHVASSGSCTCDEHQLGGARCAHIWAVRYHLLRERGDDLVIPRLGRGADMEPDKDPAPPICDAPTAASELLRRGGQGRQSRRPSYGGRP